MGHDSFLKSALKPTIDGYFEKLLNVLKDYEVIKASEIPSPEDGGSRIYLPGKYGSSRVR